MIYNHTNSSSESYGNLGSVRVVMAADGTAEQVNHYYAFGGLLGDSSGGDVQKYKYNGKELDRFLNWDMLDYGARWYDAALGRWLTPDPLAEKYYHLSPYVYCADNPVKYVDHHGDSISVSYLQTLDETLKTNYTQKLLSDLHVETGLSLYISNDGFIEYKKDEEGNPIVSKNEDNGECGSKTARDFLIDIVGNESIVKLEGGRRTCVPESDPNTIGVNASQIESFISGTSSGLDPRTLGWGLTIMHEMTHTEVGGKLKDEIGENKTGKTVDFINKIRHELNEQGYHFGKRVQYQSSTDGNKILFNKRQYIKFK